MPILLLLLSKNTGGITPPPGTLIRVTQDTKTRVTQDGQTRVTQ